LFTLLYPGAPITCRRTTPDWVLQGCMGETKPYWIPHIHWTLRPVLHSETSMHPTWLVPLQSFACILPRPASWASLPKPESPYGFFPSGSWMHL
jgi:hypothetical protein